MFIKPNKFLQRAYIKENGVLKIPASLYTEINFTLKRDKLFLSEYGNSIVISKEYNSLPVCDVIAQANGIKIDCAYCLKRGLFSPEVECMRESHIPIPVPVSKEEKQTLWRTLLTYEYRVLYYIEDNSLIIPFSQHMNKEEYHHHQRLENCKLLLPSFVSATLKIRQNTALKATVKDGIIYCRKCLKTETIEYNQTITYDELDISLKEQLLIVQNGEITLESYLLRAAHIEPTDSVIIRLTRKKEFVIERTTAAQNRYLDKNCNP